MGCCTSSPSPSPVVVEQVPPPAPARENQPIRPPTPLSRTPKNVSRHQPPWTRAIYENELRVFFETRQGGDRGVWVTLEEVGRLMRGGRVGEAQVLMDAAGLSCPNGRVARTRSATLRAEDGGRLRGGVYDVRGQRYDLPSWVLTEPADLIESPRPTAPEKDIDENNGTDEDEEPTAAQQQPDKGKGRAQDPGEELQVRIRYNDLPKDAIFAIGSKQPVSILREKIQQARGTDKVKLIMVGHMWEEKHLQKSLGELGWNASMVVNAFVRPSG